jgi:hypothetical protein
LTWLKLGAMQATRNKKGFTVRFTHPDYGWRYTMQFDRSGEDIGVHIHLIDTEAVVEYIKHGGSAADDLRVDFPGEHLEVLQQVTDFASKERDLFDWITDRVR